MGQGKEEQRRSCAAIGTEVERTREQRLRSTVLVLGNAQGLHRKGPLISFTWDLPEQPSDTSFMCAPLSELKTTAFQANWSCKHICTKKVRRTLTLSLPNKKLSYGNY